MKWLTYGLVGLLFFGFFGFLNKLSTFQDPFLSNLIIQLTAFAVAIFIFALSRREFKFSSSATIAGVCASLGTLSLLFALMANALILVYPFAAMAGLVFFILTYFKTRLKFSATQWTSVAVGMLLCFAGLFFAVMGTAGGIKNFLQTFLISSDYLLGGLGVMLFWGLLTYFWWKARTVQKADTMSALLSTMIGVFVTALVATLIFRLQSLIAIQFTPTFVYPIASGICVAIASMFMLTAFGLTKPKAKTQNLILAILTNGEIMPVTLLALLLLGEWSVEGLIGVALSIVGLTLLNYVENL